LELAPLHRAAARVPLIDATCSPDAIAFDGDGRLVVFDGASDHTIYKCPRVNHAFRAWHDAQHIVQRVGFDLAGERAACEGQIRELLARYPSAPREVIALIRAEVIGQAEHFAAFGEFPVDQAAFITTYLEQSK
jgi:hypothetical protein